jgi:predicted amidohydrolase
MKARLNLSLIQLDILWENPSANRLKLETYFLEIGNFTDVIVLPELFTTGFSMNPAPIAETMDGITLSWLLHWAKKLETAICGSLVITENGNYYNRFVFETPQGEIETYDKRHRFMMAGEGEKYTAGSSRVLIEYLGWKILPQICYDLRFPVFSRNTVDYDVVIYVANWPKARIAAWDALLTARAIENMAYSVGVNRVGQDGNGLEYVGHSAIYDVLGMDCSISKGHLDQLSVTSEGDDFKVKEGIIPVSLSKSLITTIRAQLPFLEDRDSFTLD